MAADSWSSSMLDGYSTTGDGDEEVSKSSPFEESSKRIPDRDDAGAIGSSDVSVDILQWTASARRADVTIYRRFPKAFTNALKWSLRGALSAVLAASVISIPFVADAVGVPFFAAVLAVLAVNNTLGSSYKAAIHLAWGSLTGAVVSVVFSLIVRFVVGFLNESAKMPVALTCCAIGIFVSTFCIAAFDQGPAPRRILAKVLSMAGHLALLTDLNEPWYFPFQICLAVAVGCTCGMLVYVLMPRKSTAVVKRAMEAVGETTGGLYSELVDAFMTRGEAEKVAVHLDTAQKMMMVIEAKAADVARHTPMVRWEKWTSGVGALTPKTIRRFFELHARALSSLKAMRRALRVLETSDHYARFWEFLAPSVAASRSDVAFVLGAEPHRWHVPPLSDVVVGGPPTLPDIRSHAENVLNAYQTARLAIFFDTPDVDFAALAPAKSSIAINFLVFSLTEFLETVALLEDERVRLSGELSGEDSGEDLDLHEKKSRGMRCRAWCRTTARNGCSSGGHIWASAQVGLGIVLASLLSIIPSVSANQPFAIWASLTVIFLMDKSFGASLQKGILRLIGTVLGALGGYMALILANDSALILLLLLFIIVFAGGYVRSSAQYSYAGLVAAFTAPIIMFGNTDPDISNQTYALARIEQTCFGLFVVVMVSAVSRTPWVGHRLGTSGRKFMERAAFCLGDLLAFRSTDGTDDGAAEVVEDALAEMRTVASDFSALIVLADVEPQLWRSPVPIAEYRAISASLQRIACHTEWLVDCCRVARRRGVFANQHKYIFTRARGALSKVSHSIQAGLETLATTLEASSAIINDQQRISAVGLSVRHAADRFVETQRAILFDVVNRHHLGENNDGQPVIAVESIVLSNAFAFALGLVGEALQEAATAIQLMCQTERLLLLQE